MGITLLGLTGEISLSPVLTETETFILNRDWGFQTQDGKQFWLPAGFKIDGGSVPTLFWGIISPWQAGTQNATPPHDWFYFTGCVTKDEADWYMLEILNETRDEKRNVIMPLWKRRAMFLAVSKSPQAQAAWDKCRREAIAAGFANGIRPAYEPPAPMIPILCGA